jgi:hypothetical protein
MAVPQLVVIPAKHVAAKTGSKDPGCNWVPAFAG